MIPSSRVAKTIAATSALALCAMALAAGVRNAPVEIEGGGARSQSPAQLGSSFADMAQGTERPDEAEPTEPVAPDAAAPVRPDPPIRAESGEERAVPVDPSPVTMARPVAPERAASLPSDVVPQVAVRPDVVDGTPDAPEAAAPSSADIIVGEAPEPGVVVASRRPNLRSRTFEEAHRQPDPPPQRQARTENRRAAPQGNADSNARAGSQSGNRAAQAAQDGRQARAVQAGNAAASNYPGQVMARLNRVRRPSVRATGAARVAFSVAASGGLATVGIARSSGSAELDRAAVQLVRRAAPFPSPPPGAQRNFAINIAGR